MNTVNSKTKHSNKFIYNFTDKLHLKNPNKNIALANLSIYYTWKNVKSDYNNNKFKISAPTWNDTFDKYGKSIINSKNIKKLMNGATKTSKDFAKIAGKKIIHKSAEARGDLVSNKIADKITSMGKPRSKKEKDETNIMEETQEIYIPPEKRKQIIKDLKLF